VPPPHRCFRSIVEAIAGVPVRSRFIDGEAIVVDERGLSAFDLIRYGQHDRAAVLYPSFLAFNRHLAVDR
jgi:hypothetical protein